VSRGGLGPSVEVRRTVSTMHAIPVAGARKRLSPERPWVLDASEAPDHGETESVFSRGGRSRRFAVSGCGQLQEATTGAYGDRQVRTRFHRMIDIIGQTAYDQGSQVRLWRRADSSSVARSGFLHGSAETYGVLLCLWRLGTTIIAVAATTALSSDAPTLLATAWFTSITMRAGARGSFETSLPASDWRIAIRT